MANYDVDLILRKTAPRFVSCGVTVHKLCSCRMFLSPVDNQKHDRFCACVSYHMAHEARVTRQELRYSTFRERIYGSAHT